MLKLIGLTAHQFAFPALVVATVELIDDEMFDLLELLLHRRMAMDMGFEVAGIIMDDRIGVDLRQLHGSLHHLDFVWQTFIDNVFFCCSFAARTKRL